MGKRKGIIKEALKVNAFTLVVFALLYFFCNGLFSLFSTGQDGEWLLSQYVTLKNNGRSPVYEENILICTIAGVNSRDSIAAIIERLNGYNPLAIGCDIIFSRASGIDSLQSLHLKQAVEGNSRIVVAQRPVLDGLGRLSSVEESIFENSIAGDVTVYSDGCHFRETYIEGQKFVSFSSLVAETAVGNIEYPSEKYAINYTNRYFPVLGIDDICREDVEGKIVLLGDTEDLRDYVDLDFATADHRFHETLATSKRVPGIFLHAYAVATMINGDWIVTVPKWISLLLGFTASFLLCLLGEYWEVKGIPRCYFKCVHLVLFTLMIWMCYPLYLAFDIIISPLYFTIGVAMTDFSAAGLDTLRYLKAKLSKLVRKNNVKK